MTNTNPDTGIRFGVISGNSLDATVFDDLFYSGENITEKEALEELRKEIEAEADSIAEEAEATLREAHPGLTNDEYSMLLDAEIEACYEHRGYADRDDFIEAEYQKRCEFLSIDEPTIEGESGGVKYMISWLGGAPLLWVIEGPLGFAKRLCSPCVPNAADLDGGFEPTSIPANEIHRDHDGYLCYVVPADWLAKEE